MKRHIAICLAAGMLLAVLALTAVAVGYYYIRWRPQWACAEPRPAYPVARHGDDTLRVALIGDSWVGLRTPAMDSLLAVRLSRLTGRPVKVASKGKGGAKSRGIYEMMFQERGDGTRPLIAAGIDYCVVSAGINDAAGNLGVRQYEHHVRLTLDLLRRCGIRPVMIAAPDVNIWNIYADKPRKDLLTDYVRSRMTGSGMYHYAEYREAMGRLAAEEHSTAAEKRLPARPALEEHSSSRRPLEKRSQSRPALLLPAAEWNGTSTSLNPALFLGDSIHLNRRGYERLDSCLAETIARDLKQPVHAAPF